MPLSDIFAAMRWWTVLMVLGTAVTPLAYTVFHRLPDRGYAFIKMLGLLLVSYLFWLLGSLGFLDNSVGGILFALIGVAGFSAWLSWRDNGAVWRWLRKNWRQVLVTELLFLLLFAFWAWVRAQNPAITGTEKPMEFAFLNAASHSPSYPPLDPWLSGFAISYYYFGYVMTSMIARLAAVPESIAFNLGIAWLLAGTAVGAFGLVYNLVALHGAAIRRRALALGCVAALALPLAGNLQVILETIHISGLGSPQFWAWLDVKDINGPAVARDEWRFWWWWRSSRVINEYTLSGQEVQGLEPIAEFPGFSFILGDMHPHVLALPFAFLSLAVALAWQLTPYDQRLKIEDLNFTQGKSLIPNLQSLIPNWPLWALTALILGGLSFLNTWDVLIHLFVVLGAFFLAQWRAQGWHSRLLTQTAVVGALLIVPAFLLYLPFYLGFRSQAGPPFLLPMLMRPTRLAHFLIIFGLPLFAITAALLAAAVRQRFRYWQVGIITAVSVVAGLFFLMLFLGWVVASSAEGAGRVSSLAAELGLALPPRPEGEAALGWGATAVFTILPAVVQARLLYPGVTLLLATILGLTAMLLTHDKEEGRRKKEEGFDAHASSWPFVLLLIVTGALLAIGPEFVYLRDNFGVRLNTVFKFYYQAWVMFGVAALLALDYLWREFEEWKAAPALATAVYGAVFILTLLFPYQAIQTRAVEYRGPADAANRAPATLDGLAYLQRGNPDEYEAIMWLRQNMRGAPVLLEATGGAYSSYGRVSASTGLPTLLGWANHQYQWRGHATPEPGERDPAIREIYAGDNWNRTAELLNRYDVSYIYVGGLERNTYGQNGRLPGQELFEQRLEVAYGNNSVTIYRWRAE